MRLTYAQQCQRADDECSDGVYSVARPIAEAAIKLMPRDDSHLAEIAREVKRMFWGERS